jgi:alkylhydroperoxidase/carboxymuconolactone decarboxylase family protein YurZ
MQSTEEIAESYLDRIFGQGMGRKHVRFLAAVENRHLRDAVLRFHGVEGDERALDVVTNYMCGMSVLYATRSFGTAGMFAKALRHLGVKRATILEAVGRLSMWVGGVIAIEATAHAQKALDDWERRGLLSLEARFPEEAP